MDADQGRKAFWNVEHCCFAWDLKSGIVVSTVIGLTVVFSSFIVNIGLAQNYLDPLESFMFQHYKHEERMAYIVMFLYLITSMVAYILLFYAVLKVKAILMYVGWGLLGVCFLIWIVVTMLSYQRDSFRKVCVSTRCPDAHWFMPSGWRALLALQLLDCKSTAPGGPRIQVEVSRPPDIIVPRHYTKYDLKKILRKDHVLHKIIDEIGVIGLNNGGSIKNNSAIKRERFYRSILYDIRKNTNTSQEYTKRAIQFLQYANLMNQVEFRDLQYYYGATEEEEEESDLHKEEEEKVVRKAPARDVLQFLPPLSYTYDMDPLLVAYSVTLAVAWGIFMLHTHFLLLMYILHIKRLKRLPCTYYNEEG